MTEESKSGRPAERRLPLEGIPAANELAEFEDKAPAPESKAENTPGEREPGRASPSKPE